MLPGLWRFMPVRVTWVAAELKERRTWNFPVGRVPCITSLSEHSLTLSQTNESNEVIPGGLSEMLVVTNENVNGGKLWRAVKRLGYAF